MVRFEEKLRANAVRKWEEYYCDYGKLKKEISRCKKVVQAVAEENRAIREHAGFPGNDRASGGFDGGRPSDASDDSASSGGGGGGGGGWASLSETLLGSLGSPRSGPGSPGSGRGAAERLAAAEEAFVRVFRDERDKVATFYHREIKLQRGQLALLLKVPAADLVHYLPGPDTANLNWSSGSPASRSKSSGPRGNRGGGVGSTFQGSKNGGDGGAFGRGLGGGGGEYGGECVGSGALGRVLVERGAVESRETKGVRVGNAGSGARVAAVGAASGIGGGGFESGFASPRSPLSPLSPLSSHMSSYNGSANGGSSYSEPYNESYASPGAAAFLDATSSPVVSTVVSVTVGAGGAVGAVGAVGGGGTGTSGGGGEGGRGEKGDNKTGDMQREMSNAWTEAGIGTNGTSSSVAGSVPPPISLSAMTEDGVGGDSRRKTLGADAVGAAGAPGAAVADVGGSVGGCGGDANGGRGKGDYRRAGTAHAASEGGNILVRRKGAGERESAGLPPDAFPSPASSSVASSRAGATMSSGRKRQNKKRRKERSRATRESKRRALIHVYRQLKFLQNFCIVNYTAFIKGVKKLKKNTGWDDLCEELRGDIHAAEFQVRRGGRMRRNEKMKTNVNHLY